MTSKAEKYVKKKILGRATLSNSKFAPPQKKPGFEPMTSALALQCSTN